MADTTHPRGESDSVRRQLHALVESGDHAGLATFLSTHAPHVDALDETGRSPLLRAVERGDHRAAELLLAAGASASAHGPGGSALEVAAGRADAPVVELLLEHGARELRVAFRIASERRARPIMEMIAHREPTLQLQLEFDEPIPDQKLVATEAMTKRLPEPVLTLGDNTRIHLSWEGVRNTYVETVSDRPDRAFTVEVQQRLRLWHGERELGEVDGMWYSAVASGPASPPTRQDDGSWRVRYAYYATAGAYQHYSAVDVTFDLVRGTLAVNEQYDAEP